MTDVPHPFAPFHPAIDSTLQPSNEKPAKKPRKAKEVIAENAAQDRAIAAQPDKPARKPRAPNKTKGGLKAHSPKFDLQTTLAAAQLLKEDDFPLFEKLVVMLDEAGKPGRDRVLGALGKVFG